MKNGTKLMLLLLTAASFTASALAMEDGIYRDKAPGYGGDVIVTAVIRGGRIESFATKNTGGEKSEYYLKAEQALSEAIIAANGLDGVDAVSGATGTSESILSAMRGIMEQVVYTGGANGTVNSVKEATITPTPHQTI